MALGAVCSDLALASVIVARLAAAVVELGDGANPLCGPGGVLACGACRSLPTTTTATSCSTDHKLDSMEQMISL
jgi:hypothetical protein